MRVQDDKKNSRDKLKASDCNLQSAICNLLCIFDLDGTLINSLDDLAVAVNYALKKHGFPEHELGEYRHFVGNGVDKLLERALPAGKQTAEQVTLIKGDFLEYYGLHKMDRTAPYPGIPELLSALKEQGMLLAVASNKYHSATQALVKSFFGTEMFDFVYGQRENVPPKPDPTVVFDILQESGIAPENTLYIGDSGVDMQTACASGTTAVGVLWGFRSREELLANGAEYLIEEPKELLLI